MNRSYCILELSVEVLAGLDQAEPFLGCFDTLIPPVRAGYWTDHLHAGGQTLRDQSLGNGVGVFLAFCRCDDLDEVWDGEAPLYSGTVIAPETPRASPGRFLTLQPETRP